jgi:photosystem II stability/assembly factor-like uncharacterized protein
MRRFGIPRSTLLTLACAAMMAAAAVGLAALPPAAAAAPFASPDGLWTWSRPLPHGYPAVSVSAAAPGVLFVASSVSDVLATADGGASWMWSRTSAVPGFAGPDGVQFVSATEGWAWGADTAGDDGMVLHTTDAGSTWQLSLSIPGLQSLLVRFADPSTGWVVAGNGLSSYQDYKFSTTTDGGQTWSAPVYLPQDAHASDATLGAFAVQGGARAMVTETGWAPGGRVTGTTVWRTVDGGATWLTPNVLKGVHVVDAAFSSPSMGWAAGTRTLWRTTNGGTSWRKVRRAPLYGHLVTAGDNVWLVSR